MFKGIYLNLKSLIVLWQRLKDSFMPQRQHGVQMAILMITHLVCTFMSQCHTALILTAYFISIYATLFFPNHQLHNNKNIIGFAFIHHVSTAQFLLHYHGFGKHVLNSPTYGFLHHFHHRIISLSFVFIYYPGKHFHLPIRIAQRTCQNRLLPSTFRMSD